MKKSGFTLIEMIVVVAILGMVAIFGSNMLFTILKGSLKTKVLSEVKQNGTFAISTMERMIRNAKELVSCDSGSVKIKNPDDFETTFVCSDTAISSNSAALTSSNVKVDSCAFACSLGTAGILPSTVGINFTLSQVGAATRKEEKALVKFQTTVSLRNY